MNIGVWIIAIIIAIIVYFFSGSVGGAFFSAFMVLGIFTPSSTKILSKNRR